MSRILITIPTWNEAVVIERNLGLLEEAAKKFLSGHDVMIEIADNGSTDGTREIVRNIVGAHGNAPSGRSDGRGALPCAPTLIEIPERGKGLAIRRSWERHLDDADVLVFMDADLAADLSALTSLVAPILENRADLVCGSRFLPGAVIERAWSREVASHLYRVLQRIVLRLPVKDAQCGFKAISPRVAREVLPLCQETGWMFDTELIARVGACATRPGAWHAPLQIMEIPVSWIEHRHADRRSALRLFRHGWGFFTGLFRIWRRVKGG